MKKYNTVIFDFDGLLVDTEIVSYHIYEDILKETNQIMTIQEYANDYSGHSEVDNIHNLIQTYHLSLTEKDCFDKVIYYENILLDQGVDLKKGVKELLNYLKEKKYRIVLATGSTKERCIKILQQHSIYSYFDYYVYFEDVTKGKPDPELFLTAANKAKSNSEQCLVLEDSSAGIDCAVNAKIDVICIPDLKKPDNLHLDKTVSVFSDLSQVIDFLEKNN